MGITDKKQIFTVNCLLKLENSTIFNKVRFTLTNHHNHRYLRITFNEVRRLVNVKEQRAVSAAQLPRLLFLGICFFIGLILGHGIALHMPDQVYSQLNAYLTGFLALEQRQFSDAAFSTLLLYIRYPLLVFFLGFASIGVVFLPLTSIVFGFFLSFSASCFAASFGKGGILLALAAFGLRALITIPCFFLLAAPSWEMACALASRSWGKGKRFVPPVYGKSWWMRLAVVSGILLFGVCLDLMISPYLLEWVLRGFF